MTIGTDGLTHYGTDPETFAKQLAEWGADVIGVNCSVGPAGVLDAVERMVKATDRPISAVPNAGLPKDVGDRKIYLASPEYMASYARRMIEAGARILGGCCGTTPQHIKKIRDYVASVLPRHQPAGVSRETVTAPAGVGEVALSARSCLGADPPKMGPYPEATAVFDIDSIGLTNLVYRLNHGLDPGNNPIGAPTQWAIGVGVNPGAVDLDRELSRFAWKVDAGAEFAVTQPVFDPKQLEAFLTRVGQFKIPIVAGVLPLPPLRNAQVLAHEVPGGSVPGMVLARMGQGEGKGTGTGGARGVENAPEEVGAGEGREEGW